MSHPRQGFELIYRAPVIGRGAEYEFPFPPSELLREKRNRVRRRVIFKASSTLHLKVTAAERPRGEFELQEAAVRH